MGSVKVPRPYGYHNQFAHYFCTRLSQPQHLLQVSQGLLRSLKLFIRNVFTYFQLIYAEKINIHRNESKNNFIKPLVTRCND